MAKRDELVDMDHGDVVFVGVKKHAREPEVLVDMDHGDVVFVEVKKHAREPEVLAGMDLGDVAFVEVKKPRAREPEVRAPDAAVQEVLLEPLQQAFEPSVEELIYTIGKEGRCECGFEGVCVRATAFACKSGCAVWAGTRVCRGCAPRVEREAVCPECAGASQLP